ncbi:N-acetylmuramoyl-L-alanine amidase [Actinomycetospora sp. NBRC 106375]|uniref:N-acetylmuramoyl-L-alanine amidase n=1 Tax=Actinomycetospora sp. NBRC 106375 TaxID=3032207 RepID=UPI0024A15522|nr:N-acetylmuramoyl-L-alanine amidase [Actinomycetospora sp. NBRC 106375]GLZ45929.1 N-acetylmuramoyl-L-alanine amidase [Actinomycetospora sp. NBRC 106375]
MAGSGGRRGRAGRARGSARAGTALTAAVTAIVTAVLASGPAAAAEPGVPTDPATATAVPAVPADAAALAPTGVQQLDPAHAVMPPAGLPPAAPVASGIQPVTYAPGARDAFGGREARSETPLRLVAVTWNGPAPDAVSLRSTDAAGNWGTWSDLDPAGSEKESPTPTGAPDHGGTDPIWVGDRTGVEVRAMRAGQPVTDQVQVVRIDPGVGSNDEAIGSLGAARGPAAPKYVTRAQWGADESKMTWPPQTTPAVRAVTIHHTSESNDYSPAESAAIVRGIYAYHAEKQGWGDVGYNALVDKYGTIFEGRAGGLDRNVVAAHAGGFNRETFGIAMMGNYTTVQPTPAQMNSVAALAAWKLGGLYQDPRQQVTLTSSGGGTSRVPKGQSTTVPALFAHRDVGRTSCPGDAAYAMMEPLRAKVQELIAQAAGDVRTAWSADRALLGEPTRVEAPTADGQGRSTDFEHGTVIWSPRTGAWPVTGAIAEHWRAAGAERSPLGYPTSGEYDVPTGRQQNFEHGALTWARTTGTVGAPA